MASKVQLMVGQVNQIYGQCYMLLRGPTTLRRP